MASPHEGPHQQPPQSPEPEPTIPQERLARLKTENPDIEPSLFDDVVDWGNRGRHENVDHYFATHWGQDLTPEQKEKLIVAYNLGAEMEGHPHYEEPSATSTHETAMPITEPVLTKTALAAESPQSTEAETADEPQEIANTALEEAKQRLDEARTEYARLAVAEEKQNKNRPRKRQDVDEGQPQIRVNLLRDDLTPIEGLEDAETKYLAAVQEIRKLRGEQIRTQLEREKAFAVQNLTEIPSKKEVQKRMDALIEETVIREGIALYDEKTRLRLTSESGSYSDRAWKYVQRAAEGYNKLDAYHRVEINPDLPWYSKENLKARGHNIPRNKMMISAALFGASLGAGFAGLTAAGTIVGLGKLGQRTLGGMAVGIAADAGISKLFAFTEKKEIMRGLKNTREDITDFERNLTDILDAHVENLNQRLLNIDTYKQSFLGKSTRKISRIGGVTVGAFVGSGTAAHLAREGLTHLSELTGITPASIAQKLGVSKNLIAKLPFIGEPTSLEAAEPPQAGAASAVPAGGVTPKELSFWQKLGIVARGSLGDKTPIESQKPDMTDTSAKHSRDTTKSNVPAAPETAKEYIIEQQIEDLRVQWDKNYDAAEQLSDPVAKAHATAKRVELWKEIRLLQEKLFQTERSPTPPPLSEQGKGDAPTMRKSTETVPPVAETSPAPEPRSSPKPHPTTETGAKDASPALDTKRSTELMQMNRIYQENLEQWEQEIKTTTDSIEKQKLQGLVDFNKKLIAHNNEILGQTKGPAMPDQQKQSPLPEKPTPQPAPAPKTEAPSPPLEATTPLPRPTLSPEAEKLATVRKGEGAWQAVRRQFYERIRAEPEKYKLTAEEVRKLPELDKLGKETKAAKILNRETLATLKNAGYINLDGTTKLGITKPGVKIFLDSEGKLMPPQGKGKLTYGFPEQKAGGAGHPVDETRRARGRVGTSRSYQDYTTGENAPGGVPYATNQFLAPATPEKGMTSAEYAASPTGIASAQATAVKTESGNLHATHLTKTEYRPIERMRGKVFIDELARHATEIREHRGPRRSFSIFINREQFGTRGFTAELKEAEKYLDLSERLEKHLGTLRYSERTRLLKQPIGEILRTLSLTKNK